MIKVLNYLALLICHIQGIQNKLYEYPELHSDCKIQQYKCRSEIEGMLEVLHLFFLNLLIYVAIKLCYELK